MINMIKGEHPPERTAGFLRLSAENTRRSSPPAARHTTSTSHLDLVMEMNAAMPAARQGEVLVAVHAAAITRAELTWDQSYQPDVFPQPGPQRLPGRRP
jgi:hypothetical protein